MYLPFLPNGGILNGTTIRETTASTYSREEYVRPS